MRAVIQRVLSAEVVIENVTVGSIERGLLVFVGVGEGDQLDDLDYLAEKILHLRVFSDSEGKMNLSVNDVNGSLLLVSQFTLWGDCRKGRRPSFINAANPELARRLYDTLIEKLRSAQLRVETGVFGADMKVELVNDGPVTILLDSRKSF
jgi:D-tyrosyl-tRNA(Tyr) deacylase